MVYSNALYGIGFKYIHLLIDYKVHADVSFTDSLGLTGTSNMAHHQVFHAVWVGCISVSVSLSPDAILAPASPPPVFQPVQFIAASGSPLEHQTFVLLDILCSCQSKFSYRWMFSATHSLTIDHCCLTLCIRQTTWPVIFYFFCKLKNTERYNQYVGRLAALKLSITEKQKGNQQD